MLFTLECVTLCSHRMFPAVFTLDDAVHTGVRHTVFTPHCRAVFTMDAPAVQTVCVTQFTPDESSAARQGQPSDAASVDAYFTLNALSVALLPS